MTDNKNIALLIAINDYRGTENDLKGCLNDQSDMEVLLHTEYRVVKLSDDQATVSNVKSKLKEIISILNKGDKFVIHYSGHGTQVIDKNGDEKDGYDEALYLYDGCLIDDELHSILMNLREGVVCLVLLDSCFSGTATRGLNQKNRFVTTDSIEPHFAKQRSITKVDDMKWCVISGCSENQTSADGVFNGRPNGAFTYYLIKSVRENITIKDWFKNLRKLLPSWKYSQIPTLEGNRSLFNQKIV